MTLTAERCKAIIDNLAQAVGLAHCVIGSVNLSVASGGEGPQEVAEHRLLAACEELQKASQDVLASLSYGGGGVETIK